MKPPSENSGGAHDVDPSTPLRTSLDRLLRAASKAKDEAPVEMPFGSTPAWSRFRAATETAAVFGAFMRRVALIAAGIIVLATAGALISNSRGMVMQLRRPVTSSPSPIQPFKMRWAMNSALKWKLIAGFLLVFIAGGATGVFVTMAIGHHFHVSGRILTVLPLRQ